MKHLAAIPLLMAALALPALTQRGGGAQHGGARGGFSAPTAPAPRSFSPRGFSPGAGAPRSFSPRSFGPAPVAPRVGGGFPSHGPIGVRPSPGPYRFNPGGPGVSRPIAPRTFNHPAVPYRFGSSYSPRTRIPYTRTTGGDHVHGRGGHDHDHDGDHHHHHRGVYYGGYVYPYYPWFYTGPIFTGYVDPWLFGPEDYYGSGYSDGYGYGGDVPAPYRDYGMQDSQPYPSEYYQSNPATPQQDQQLQQDDPHQAQAPPAASPGSAGNSRPVTLIFNDGRPPVQIHNYLLTGSTLTVLDAQYREIPLDKINVAATEHANRAAGVDFRVPVKQ